MSHLRALLPPVFPLLLSCLIGADQVSSEGDEPSLLTRKADSIFKLGSFASEWVYDSGGKPCWVGDT